MLDSSTKEEFRIRSPTGAQEDTKNTVLSPSTSCCCHTPHVGGDGSCWACARAAQFSQNRRLVQNTISKDPTATTTATASAATSIHKDPQSYTCLSAEDDEGDVEYKWRLTGISAVRFEHLVTQMQFRVTEGNGQCLYQLGVLDNGFPRGLPQSALFESIATIERMAAALDFDCEVLQQCVVSTDPELLLCGEVLVSRRHARHQDVGVVFCGAAGCGKSTLMGVLLSDTLDDGSGSTRQSLFNHKHEVDSGRTTSIATRLWAVPCTTSPSTTEEDTQAITSGFSDDEDAAYRMTTTVTPDAALLQKPSRGVSPLPPAPASPITTASRSVSRSSTTMRASPVVAGGGGGGGTRKISLMDVGGDITKNMLFGLMSRKPDYVCICVAADADPGDVALYAQVCCAMSTPFMVVATKCDVVEEFELDAFCMDIAATLKDVGCACDVVDTKEMAMTYCQQLMPPVVSPTASSIEDNDNDGDDTMTPPRVPLFVVSSVEGHGFDILSHGMSYLRATPPSALPIHPNSPKKDVSAAAPFEVLLDGAFQVAGVGPVVRGRVARGSVQCGTRCFIGPDMTGEFHSVVIHDIHVDGAHVNTALVHDEATFALNHLPAAVDLSQKGKALVSSSTAEEKVCVTFVLLVRLLCQSIGVHMQPILYSRNVRQAVRVRAAVKQQELNPLAHDSEWNVTCEFMFRPEMLTRDAPVVLHWTPNGIAVGKVVELRPLRTTDLQH